MRINWFMLGVAGWLGVVGCSRAPVVLVRNQSSQVLSNVVVSGAGFSERLGILPPGGEQTLRVRPQGDSGLRLAFEAGGRLVDSGGQGYFEAGGGYRVTVIVGTNLAVSVTEELRKF